VSGFDRQIAESTIPNTYVRVIVDTLKMTKDINTLTELERQVPWFSQTLKNLSNINAIQFAHLLELLSKETTNPNLGIQIGKRIPPHSHGLLGGLALSAPTLQAALKNCERFQSLFVPFIKIKTHVGGGYFVTTVSLNIPMATKTSQFLMDLMCGSFDEFIRLFTGKENNIERIDFITSSASKTDYSRFFSAELHFDHKALRAYIPWK